MSKEISDPIIYVDLVYKLFKGQFRECHLIKDTKVKYVIDSVYSSLDFINYRLSTNSLIIYWSNVLTERFCIPYKIETKEDTSL